MNKHNMPNARRGIAISLSTVAAAAVLAACGSSDDGPAAAAPLTADTVAARQHIFGAENVDSAGLVRTDLVLFSWISNTTFAASISGTVMLLDASILRRETTAARVPTSLAELTALMPKYVLLGKASAGHADLAAALAVKSRATIVGAQEHCDTVQADATRLYGASAAITCNAVIPAAEALGAKVHAVALEPGLCLRAIKNIDTSSVAKDTATPVAAFNWSAGSDLRDPVYWPAGAAANDGVGTNGAATSPAVLYQFVVPGSRGFAVTWNATSGPLKEAAPAVATLLAQLPKTDVQIGSVDSENVSNNGLRDPALYIKGVAPKLFYPGGHDAGAQRHGAYATAEYVRRGLVTAMTAVGASSTLRFLDDPRDYVLPEVMTFDPASSAWTLPTDRALAAGCN